ncbi:MAG: L-histidine N(alpha)-methyltransferase [Hyphomicrobiaceae bacterium]
MKLKRAPRAEVMVDDDAEHDLLHVVLRGLGQSQKTLPPYLFYDARGSELFEAITRLPEYYQTRTEISILDANARDIAASIPDGSVLIELGSGSSIKTELILAAKPDLRAYIPIDVSSSALDLAEARLLEKFPQLDIRPIVGDFKHAIALPGDLQSQPRVGFFPGSTIGNSSPREACHLLSTLRTGLLSGGTFIVGADTKKDEEILQRAYDDSAGVTAQFNLNLLARLNRELGANFDLTSFRHKALYDAQIGRIEMHLESLVDQVVSIGGTRIAFRRGETIHTENSYKYTINEFQALCRSSGWRIDAVWSDAKDFVCVYSLTDGT